MLVHRGVDARVVAGAVDQRGGLEEVQRKFLADWRQLFRRWAVRGLRRRRKAQAALPRAAAGKEAFSLVISQQVQNPAGRLCLLLSYQTARRILKAPPGIKFRKTGKIFRAFSRLLCQMQTGNPRLEVAFRAGRAGPCRQNRCARGSWEREFRSFAHRASAGCGKGDDGLAA